MWNCLETYGYQTEWKNGSVENEADFLSSLQQKMRSRFSEEWIKKMSTSERFTAYSIVKSVHQAEKYLNDITIKKFRNYLIIFRLEINERGVNIRCQSETHANRNCPCVQLAKKTKVILCSADQHIIIFARNILLITSKGMVSLPLTSSLPILLLSYREHVLC